MATGEVDCCVRHAILVASGLPARSLFFAIMIMLSLKRRSDDFRENGMLGAKFSFCACEK
ncbi:hypothetical protein B0E45_01050 [Sinorhizobium sp. A49]|nr:hypothetical protein B0E45_01050 [Sinorhizobium sp. A49]